MTLARCLRPCASPLRLYSAKVCALLAFALLAFVSAPPPAHAQWVVKDQTGAPLSTNYEGSYSLTGYVSGTGICTYPSDLGAYISDVCTFSPLSWPDYFNRTQSPSLSWNLGFDDCWLNNYSLSFPPFIGTGFYNNGSILEPLNGRVQETASAPLSADFVWAGAGPAPDHLDVLLRSHVYATAFLFYSTPDVPAGLSVTATASDGLGTDLTATGEADPYPAGSVSGGKTVLKRFPVVNGVARVSVTASVGVTAIDEVPYGGVPVGDDFGPAFPATDNFSTNVYASATQDNREVAISTSLDGLPGNGASQDPTDRHLDGYATLNWKVQDDDTPSVPFYDGYARYFLNATGFTPTSYAWQVSPNPFVQSTATDADRVWQLPDTSISEKDFHCDLGDDFTRFPQTTQVQCTAAGTDPDVGSFSGPAKATVTWHSPWESGGGGGPLTLTQPVGADLILDNGPNGQAVSNDQVQAGQTILYSGQRFVILTVQTNPDDTLSFYLAPAVPTSPQDGDDVMQLVQEYQQRTHQAIEVGKVGLQLGFEAYNQAGQAYVMGPLYEVASGQLFELGGNAIALIGRSLEGSKAAEYYEALASYGGSLLPGLRQKVADLKAAAAAGTATDAQVASAQQALTDTEISIAKFDQAAADVTSTTDPYDYTGTEVKQAVEDAQNWQAETAAGKNCFAAGTLVWMADGSLRPIEQVKAGDLVLSRDPQTGVTAAKAVVRTFRHQADDMVSLRFPGGDTLRCTEGHPFYVAGRGFVPAGRLALGTSIVTRAGPLLALSQSDRQTASTTVYNFEVADFHTYFVGKSGLWVHNTCQIPAGTPTAFQVAFSNNNPSLIDTSTGIPYDWNLHISDYDVVQPDANGTIWLIEDKTCTGYWKDNITEMTEQQKQKFIKDRVIQKLDDYLAMLQCQDLNLANYFGSSNPAVLLQDLHDGRIRFAFRNTGTCSASMRFRMMRAVTQWERDHAAQLGGLPVGFQL